MEQQIYTVPQVARLTGMSRATVLTLIHQGRLEAADYRLKPNAQRPRWRITQEAIDAFHKSHVVTPQPAAPARRRQRGNGGPAPKQFV